MSLTLPGNYSSASFISAINEDYLVELYKSGSDDVSIGLSFTDRTVSGNFYNGVIDNIPVIRESIDLGKSTAKQSSLSLKTVNFPYSSSDFKFSGELFGSGNNYINQKVKLYSCLNNVSTLDDCLLLDEYRLVDIKHDNESVELLLVQQRPWDFIDFPQNKTAVTNKYFPVVYGNFTREESLPINSGSGPQYCNSASVFPVPVNDVIGDNIKGLLHYGTGFSTGSNQRENTNPSNANLHFYEKNIDVFVPLYPVNTTTINYENGQGINVSSSLERGFKWNDLEEHDANEFNTPLYSNYTDVDFSNYSASSGLMEVSANGDPGDPDYQQTSKRFMVNMKQPDGFVSMIKAHIRYKLEVVSATNHNTVACRITDPVGNPYAEITAITSSIGTLEINWTGSGGGINPIELIGEVEVSSEQSGEAQGQIGINELYVYATIKPSPTEPDAHNNRINDLDTLYCGGDGMLQSYSGSIGGLALNAVQVHRDILNRFTGFDVSSDQLLDWSDVQSDRFGWNIRWWALDPVPLKKTLEKLQFEGGFIFKFRQDGGRYIAVRDSYSSSDVDATLTKTDLSDFRLENSSFGELITKRVIRFDKHPKKRAYGGNVTATNDTSRTKYNIQTKENIQEVKLDMLAERVSSLTSGSVDSTAGSVNSNHTRYYDHLFGDIKTLISGTIVNGRYFNLETGDIIQIDSDSIHIKPFGSSWVNKYLMITNIQRSPGKLVFNAREVS